MSRKERVIFGVVLIFMTVAVASWMWGSALQEAVRYNDANTTRVVQQVADTVNIGFYLWGILILCGFLGVGVFIFLLLKHRRFKGVG